jgi:hypothetical protein
MISRLTKLSGLILLVVGFVYGQAVQTLWQKSAGSGTLPAYFSASGNTERGFAYGKVGGNDRIYVASRTGGTFIYVFDALTGDSVGTLSTTGISGGTFAVNDIEVTSDGVIYAGNMTSTSATSAFKLYRYATEASTPVVALSYTFEGNTRFGDNFTIVGSTADNSAKLYLPAASNDSIWVFTTADNGATFAFSEAIGLDVNMGAAPAVYPGDGGLYVNSNGNSLKHYLNTGVLAGTVPGSVVATGANSLRYFEIKGRKLVATHAYGTGNQNIRIADVTAGANNAKLYYVTATLGSNSNGNGTGDIAMRVNGDTVDVYVLGTNNGMAAYRLKPAGFVTFTLNTSTVPDTTKPTTVVQVRGSWTGWGSASPAMTNIGGDYWTLTQLLEQGVDYEYKYFVTDAPNGGWETTNNRTLNISGDVVKPVEYWSSAGAPYTPTDSIDVWFRVNMLSQESFNPATDQVHVRGSFQGWNDSTPLTREGMTHFYSGQGKVPAAGAIEYKFTYTKSGSVNWESISNRAVTVNQDTTLYWTWFNNTPYAAPVVSDTVVVTFTANLARAISERGFAIGDTIVVRSGYNATAKEVREKRMNRVGISTNYAVVDTVVAAIGRTLNYQYYVVKNALDYREIYFDFSYPDPSNPAAERRRVDVTGSTLTVLDTSASNTSSRRVPRFRNQQKLTQAVEVTYTVDLRPAVYALYSGKKLVSTNIVPYVISDPDSIKHYGVWMNGPAVGGWDVLSPWGTKADTVKMHDDGTHGDAVANDLIYSLKWNYTTADQVGQEFKFGIGSYDNEGGFGNNHIENIDDSSPTTTIASQFGSIDPVFYNAWDFDNKRPKADTTTVTFYLNTSSVIDTTKPSTAVQVRGSWTGWGSASPVMTNIGGDYWMLTQRLRVGDTLEYKYFVPGGANGGWETTNNRVLGVIPNQVLPLAYWSRTSPVYTPSDSIDVWFRVNMLSQESFNPATDAVHVRGSFNGWSDATPLMREGASHFYSAQGKVPAAGAIEYKFTYTKSGSVNWESISNRAATVSKDTTLYWKWFNDVPYGAPEVSDTVVVTFTANLSRAIAERGFAIGDTILVRSGYNATGKEVREKRLARVGISTNYSVTDTVITSIGKTLNYQYYLVKNAADYREVYFDFAYPDPTNPAAERRRVGVTGKTLSVLDTSTSNTESRRVPRFRNTQKLARAVTVKYTVDIRPAIYAIMAGKKLVSTNIVPHVVGNKDSVLIQGVYMNGPAVGGWDVLGRWGDKADTVKMVDNGTRGDVVAGDSIFTLTWSYTTADVVGQEFKFGIGSFDNEGGFGNNHIENIDDSGPTATIASQFGSIDPVFYDAWDFDNQRPFPVTSVESPVVIPASYSLDQNYPNPFNPSTTIRFGLPAESDVTLKIFNTLGQEVATLATGVMKAGVHSVTFDATNLSTGIYFYQIRAGEFTSLKKMLLIK